MKLEMWMWIRLFSRQLFLESYYVPVTVLELGLVMKNETGRVPAPGGLPSKQEVSDMAESKPSQAQNEWTKSCLLPQNAPNKVKQIDVTEIKGVGV